MTPGLEEGSTCICDSSAMTRIESQRDGVLVLTGPKDSR
jgi:hypothetical protein